MRESILSCSRERVTEEVYKILTSGAAAEILELANRLRLFEIIFPAHALRLRGSRGRLGDSPLGVRLKELDANCAAGTTLERSDMFGFLFSDLALEQSSLLDNPEPDLLIQRFVRDTSAPLFPSKKDLVTAAESILKTAHPHRKPHSPRSAAPVHREPGTAVVKRRRRRGGRGRRRGPGHGGPAPTG
jgi:tRNA nucleotidyltransferase/poly(A) polymerase